MSRKDARFKKWSEKFLRVEPDPKAVGEPFKMSDAQKQYMEAAAKCMEKAFDRAVCTAFTEPAFYEECPLCGFICTCIKVEVVDAKPVQQETTKEIRAICYDETKQTEN